MENILNMFMQQSMINMQDTTERLKNLSLQAELMQAQLDFIQTVVVMQANNQSTQGEQEDIQLSMRKLERLLKKVLMKLRKIQC